MKIVWAQTVTVSIPGEDWEVLEDRSLDRLVEALDAAWEGDKVVLEAAANRIARRVGIPPYLSVTVS